jgi:hypothetical protein
MVKFSTSSRLTCSVCGFSDVDDLGHVEGCDVAASRCCGSDGVSVPEPAEDAGLDGAREEMV